MTSADAAAPRERTLVLIKPDAVERGLEDEITRAYTDAGLTVVASRRLAPSAEVVAAHYAEHEG